MKINHPQLVLGTVQLGMKYGLNNQCGQPTESESFSILDTALAAGIDTFDTAWAYGTAEDVLGAWIRSRSLSGKVKVISKMKPHAINDYPDGTKISDIVRMELEKSLKRLGLDSLEAYMFHSPYYVYLKYAMDGLRQVKQDGLVKHVGVSVYDEAEALQAVELGSDCVQVPYNVFDQRLDSTHFFDRAKANKTTVFARSPFLQGLLLMRPDKLPTHLQYLKPFLGAFINIAQKYGRTQVEASLDFVYARCRADYIVFGVDNVRQLAQDLEDGAGSSVDDGMISEMSSAFKDLNRGAVNPSLWSKIKL